MNTRQEYNECFGIIRMIYGYPPIERERLHEDFQDTRMRFQDQAYWSFNCRTYAYPSGWKNRARSFRFYYGVEKALKGTALFEQIKQRWAELRDFQPPEELGYNPYEDEPEE